MATDSTRYMRATRMTAITTNTIQLSAAVHAELELLFIAQVGVHNQLPFIGVVKSKGFQVLLIGMHDVRSCLAREWQAMASASERHSLSGCAGMAVCPLPQCVYWPLVQNKTSISSKCAMLSQCQHPELSKIV